MHARNPLTDPKVIPTKELLEDYLGLGRYRRFEAIYDELIEMGLKARLIWSDQAKSWFHRFYYKKIPIFNIIWGIDYFYAAVILKEDEYSRLFRDKGKLKPDAAELLKRNPPNKLKGTVRVEANMEKMSDHEAFFDLLPVLINEFT